MKLDTLKKLYVEELRDIYSAEQQLVKALPKKLNRFLRKRRATSLTQ